MKRDRPANRRCSEAERMALGSCGHLTEITNLSDENVVLTAKISDDDVGITLPYSLPAGKNFVIPSHGLTLPREATIKAVKEDGTFFQNLGVLGTRRHLTIEAE